LGEERFKSAFGDKPLYPNLTVDEARQEFWWAIGKYAPHVIDDLKKEPFEAFKAAKIKRVNHLFILRDSSDVLEQAFLSKLSA